MRLTNIPDALRDQDLEPILLDGWLKRGFELTAVRASLDHHTAGAAIGYMPSLGVLTNGRGKPGSIGYLPGPLCNVGAPRAKDGDNKVYVIAGGKANHAGVGQWNGADSNYETVGLERELVGNGLDLTPWRNEVAIRVHVAFCKLLGLHATAVCRHAEYALPKGRKPDTTGITGDWLRSQVHLKLNPPIPQPPLGENDMKANEINEFLVAMYNQYFQSSPDPAGYHFWASSLLNGSLTSAQVESIFYDEWKKVHP